MSMSDPIADMLTRIRNATLRKAQVLTLPYSKVKYNLAKVIEKEGFIDSVQIDDSSIKKSLIIKLKYVGAQKEAVCATIKRISRPGLRVYLRWDQIPRNGFGIIIVSTSKGLMSDHDARLIRQGGELICKISTVRSEG